MTEEDLPQLLHSQGRSASLTRRRPGYPSASCFPAELASVSPDRRTIAFGNS